MGGGRRTVMNNAGWRDAEKVCQRPWAVTRPSTWLRTVSSSNREGRDPAGFSCLFGLIGLIGVFG